MDVKLLFNRVPSHIVEAGYDSHSLYQALHINAGKVPELDNIDIAIIGIADGRAVPVDNKISESANEIRKQLYKLRKGKSTYRIADLGNLRTGHDLEDTKTRLSELLNSLHDKEILPLIIGGTHDFDVAQYQSYEMSEKLVSILNVDALVDMNTAGTDSSGSNHVHDILLHEPNYLFDYIHLGYQSYLVPANSLEVLEKLNFNLIRLGRLRDKPKEIEPAIREADMMSFDLSSIQSSVMKATHNPIPFGLSGEEASQIAWYAGCSDKLSSAGFYGYDPLFDDEHSSSAFIVSVMVWYFIEGYYNRKDKHDFSTKHYVKYIVTLANQDPGQIIFYKSSKSDKWWMELPFQSAKNLYSRNYVVPCSYEDYTAAGKGDVPDRWVSAYAKLS